MSTVPRLMWRPRCRNLGLSYLVLHLTHFYKLQFCALSAAVGQTAMQARI